VCRVIFWVTKISFHTFAALIFNKNNMKKLISILMMFGLCLNIPSASADSNDPKETIKWFLMQNLKNTEIERMIQDSLEGVIDYDSQTIEIELNDIGSAEIFLVDSKKKVVDYIIAESYAIIDFPETTGRYTIVVWASSFYGEETIEI